VVNCLSASSWFIKKRSAGAEVKTDLKQVLIMSEAQLQFNITGNLTFNHEF
jgi:hypothetical protein